MAGPICYTTRYIYYILIKIYYVVKICEHHINYSALNQSHKRETEKLNISKIALKEPFLFYKSVFQKSARKSSGNNENSVVLM